VLDTPAGRLALGDANTKGVIPTHLGRTHVALSAPADWPIDDDHHHKARS